MQKAHPVRPSSFVLICTRLANPRSGGTRDDIGGWGHLIYNGRRRLDWERTKEIPGCQHHERSRYPLAGLSPCNETPLHWTLDSARPICSHMSLFLSWKYPAASLVVSAPRHVGPHPPPGSQSPSSRRMSLITMELTVFSDWPRPASAPAPQAGGGDLHAPTASTRDP